MNLGKATLALMLDFVISIANVVSTALLASVLTAVVRAGAAVVVVLAVIVNVGVGVGQKQQQ